ncbi:MAG TPA: DUF2721 domain-containing protein [Prosthecobacter sp.]|nr:DUF2721 domain-containing protein [Prosthecobacter sp.]
MSFPDLPLSTPSLLFPAISLIMLAYTNRFLGLAAVIRELHSEWRSTGDPMVQAQIESLRKRIRLIRNMQAMGVLSMIACVVSMGCLFFGRQLGGQFTFVTSLVLMVISLGYSFWEVALSGRALEILLGKMGEGAAGPPTGQS